MQKLIGGTGEGRGIEGTKGVDRRATVNKMTPLKSKGQLPFSMAASKCMV